MTTSQRHEDDQSAQTVSELARSQLDDQSPSFHSSQPKGSAPRSSLPSAYRLPETEQLRSTAGQAPRCVYIEVTNRCNLRCQTCPRTHTTKTQPLSLNWTRFLNIVEQFPAMDRAVLHGVGEPLLNKLLPRMVAHLEARGVKALFNTNGVLLDEVRSRALIESGLSELRVSLDAARPETYTRIRGKPYWPVVVENLRRFVRLQHQLGTDWLKVALWMTGIRENIAELPALIGLAWATGVPEVYVQRLVYFLDRDNPPGFMTNGQALFGAAEPLVDQIIARSEALARDLGIALHASGASDARTSLASSKGQASARDRVRPWTTVYVTVNGDCLPCCFGPFVASEYHILSLGNLFERPFSEIWNGQAYQAWRRALLSQEPPAACLGCGTRWSL